MRSSSWTAAVGIALVAACGGATKGTSSGPAGACGDGEFAGCAKRCDGGDGQACLTLGYGALFDKVPGGKPAAAHAFERSCKLAPKIGCEDFGTALVQGWGGPPDAPRAFKLQQDACDGGSMNGCYNLANYYLGGVGVAADPARAAALLLNRVCVVAKGDDALPKTTDGIIVQLKACKTLGKMYATGTGIAQNAQLAMLLLDYVCKTGAEAAKQPGIQMNGLTYDDACEGAKMLGAP